jgi:hypothetical protein
VSEISSFSSSYQYSTLNAVAKAHHAWLEKCAVCGMQKKLKLSSDGGDSVARNKNESVVAPVAGLAESALGESLELGGRFCAGASVRSVDISCRGDLFAFNLLYKLNCIIFNFNAFCNDNAINFIIVEYKDMFIPVNFDWSLHAVCFNLR